MLADMDVKLQAVVSHILPSIDATKLSEVVNALITAGVSDESDLCWISDDDVRHLLPPVQVQKLMCTLRTKYGMFYYYYLYFFTTVCNKILLYGKNQTCSQDRQCQDQDRKWQYETKYTQFTQKLLLSKTSMTLIDVKFTTEYCI